MKVIFLDFDGVINNFDEPTGVSEKNAKALKKIIDLTGAKVIATTSNKYTFQENPNLDYKKTTFYAYVRVLNRNGIEIHDVTPFKHRNREAEIKEYLDTYLEVEEFLIFDDDYIFENYKDHEVYLDLYNGITEEHIEPAVSILNGKLGFYPKNYNFEETYEEKLLRINKHHTKTN